MHTRPCQFFTLSTAFCYPLSPSSAHRTTRSRSTFSLRIPSSGTQRPGTQMISPLFICSLLWNSLPSQLRSVLLICTLLDKICRRGNILDSLLLGQDRPVGFPNKITTTTTITTTTNTDVGGLAGQASVGWIEKI